MTEKDYKYQIETIEKKILKKASKLDDKVVASSYETFVAIQRKIYGDNVNFTNMNIKQKVVHGWNKGYLYYIESLLIGRYNYIFSLMELRNKKDKQAILNSKIPQLDFNKNDIAMEMLRRCLKCKYLNHLDNQRKFQLFLEWILYSFKDNSVQKLSDEITDDVNTFWYQEFKLQLLLGFPYDYFGELATEMNIGKDGSYFPTPHHICELMTKLTDNKDKFKPVYDPCGGSGRLLLVSSNQHLLMYYTDVNNILYNVMLVNTHLYMPSILYSKEIIEIKEFLNIKELQSFDWQKAKEILKNKKVGK